MLDKFRTLGLIISSSFGWLLLHLGHEEKNYLLRNCLHFLQLFFLRIWHNYGMSILLVIIIGVTFVIIFNFHHFKSFFLSLFVWSYFTKKWSLFSPFLFRSFSWCRPLFFLIFNGFVC